VDRQAVIVLAKQRFDRFAFFEQVVWTALGILGLKIVSTSGIVNVLAMSRSCAVARTDTRPIDRSFRTSGRPHAAASHEDALVMCPVVSASTTCTAGSRIANLGLSPHFAIHEQQCLTEQIALIQILDEFLERTIELWQ
jgi:hypothetical protein